VGTCPFLCQYPVYFTGTLRSRMPSIAAQTIVRQLNAARKRVDLIRPLPHEAPETLNGIGALNVSVHGHGELIKR
jgi:hypothetical protein